MHKLPRRSNHMGAGQTDLSQKYCQSTADIGILRLPHQRGKVSNGALPGNHMAGDHVGLQVPNLKQGNNSLLILMERDNSETGVMRMTECCTTI